MREKCVTVIWYYNKMDMNRSKKPHTRLQYLLEVSSYGSVLQVSRVKQLGAPQAQLFTAPQEDWQVVLEETAGDHRQSEFITLTNRVVYGVECHTWREFPLTSPAMGVGSLLIFLTRPGLIALSSLRGGGERQRFIESYRSLCMLLRIQTSKTGWEWCHRLTRITGCRSPIRCGSPCLQSSSPLQPGEGGRKRQM